MAATIAAIATSVVEPGSSHIVFKGLSVSLLAAAALALNAPAAPKRWLAAIMALGSLGDILLELPGLFLAGGASFALGHLAATVFYIRNRAADPIAVLPSLALFSYGAAFPALLLPPGERLLPAIYAALLCTMAITALASRFPKHLTGLGALLFIVSDTLLIMRIGGTSIDPAWAHSAAVWASYWLAQLLIFLGIASKISRR